MHTTLELLGVVAGNSPFNFQPYPIYERRGDIINTWTKQPYGNALRHKHGIRIVGN